MSMLPKETVHVIAQSIGIASLSDEVAAALAPDAEYRMREIMQEAIKCMRHSKRSTLTADDVNSALHLRGIEPTYGFSSPDPLRFRKALGHAELYYIPDRDLDFRELMEAPLPRAPPEPSVAAHWLAIEGVQPAIPENAPLPPQALAPWTAERKPKEGETPDGHVGGQDSRVLEVKPAVKHVLSKELQLYYEKVREVIISPTESPLLFRALHSLAVDAGLHQLVPYFVPFIADEVTRGLEDCGLCFNLMRMVKALCLNKHIDLQNYVHRLMPCVITCAVAKRLGAGARPDSSHWKLRDYCADLIASILHKFDDVFEDRQPAIRVEKTLLNAFLDPKRAPVSHYGCVRCLHAMGTRPVKTYVLPNLAAYLRRLAPRLRKETEPDPLLRYQARRVHGALQEAAGSCLREEFLTKPELVDALRALPRATRLRAAAKVATKLPERGAIAGQRAARPAAAERQRMAKFFRRGDEEDSVLSSAAEPHFDGVQPFAKALPEGRGSAPGKQPVGKEGEGGKERGAKRPRDALLTAWRADADFGPLLQSLMAQFGEVMLLYVPLRELHLFL